MTPNLNNSRYKNNYNYENVFKHKPSMRKIKFKHIIDRMCR